MNLKPLVEKMAVKNTTLKYETGKGGAPVTLSALVTQ